MDDRHLKNQGVDIRYLKPEFMREEQQKMREEQQKMNVEVTILKKLVAQLTDKMQKQEAQIDVLTNSFAVCNCKNLNDIQDTPHSQDIKSSQNVQVPEVQNRRDDKNSDSTSNSNKTQNSKNAKNSENSQNIKKNPKSKAEQKKPKLILRSFDVTNPTLNKKISIQVPPEKSFAEVATSSPSLRPQTLLSPPFLPPAPSVTPLFPLRPSLPPPSPFQTPPKRIPSPLGTSISPQGPTPVCPGSLPHPPWHSQPSLLSFPPPPPMPALSPPKHSPQRPSPSAQPKKLKVRYYGDSNSKGRFSGSGIKDTILPELLKLGGTRYIPQADYDIQCHNLLEGCSVSHQAFEVPGELCL